MGRWREDEAETEPAPLPLTPEQAVALRSQLRLPSPWLMVWMQVVVALLLSLVVWLVPTWRFTAGSALYGGAVVAVSNAVLAWGLTRSKGRNAGAAAVGFMFWEFMKLGVAVILLVGGAFTMSGLHWPVLVLAMVLGLKVNWLVPLWRSRVNIVRS